MSGGDKILSRIKADCDESISLINFDCDKVCEEILSKGKEDADKASKDALAKAEKTAAQMKSSFASRAELSRRNALLKKRREEIDITIDAVSDYLLGLDAESYFNIIYKLSSKLSGKEGVVFLNQKDLQRLPSDFEKKLSESGIKAQVSSEPVKIDGGFILKCGDIEENMSFSAVLSANREKIEDLINRELFAQ
jgi:V/A-type H+-transporting ATPase subunit E